MVESSLDFFTGRLTKKERKATLADELLSDQALTQYRFDLYNVLLLLLNFPVKKKKWGSIWLPILNSTNYPFLGYGCFLRITCMGDVIFYTC